MACSRDQLAVDFLDLHGAFTGGDHVVDVLGPHHRSLVRQLAHQDVDPRRIAAHIGQDVADLDGFQSAGFRLVRSHEGLAVGQGVDVDRLAVDIDQRRAGGLGGLGHRLGGRSVDRVDDDRVHAGGYEVVDLVELARHVVLGVFDLDIDAFHSVGLFLNAVAQHGQEIVIKERHRHANVFGHCGG